MPYQPRVSELLQALRRIGCQPRARRGGSHHKWTTPGGAALIVVICKPGNRVSRTVLSSIRRILRREHLVLDFHTR